MKIEDPSIYFGKVLRVRSKRGNVTEGFFMGYNYDYDDEGNEFVEFDVETFGGIGYGFAEDEVEHIEVLGPID